jgi:hypothetical protein
MQPFTTTREQQIKAYHKIYAQLKRAGFIASTVMAWEDSHSSILRLGANNAQIPKKEDREAREMFLAQVFAFLESKGSRSPSSRFVRSVTTAS